MRACTKDTASKVGLLVFCQAWAKPDAVHDERAAAPDADRGTRGHKALADYATTRVRVAVADDVAADYAAGCAWIDSLNIAEGLMVEVAFAWDPTTDTAEHIGYDRDYSKGAGRLCGTADLVMVARMNGVVVGAMVWDWKFGNSYESGPQLRALGLMVARTFGIEQVTVAALDIGPEGVRELCREDLDAFALATIAGELAELRALIPTSEPQVGAHCAELFCPAKLSCPLIDQATPDLGGVEVIPADKLVRRKPFKLTDPIETAEHAAWATGVISLMLGKLESLKDEIKAKVAKHTGGWQLEDGRTLEERFSTVKATTFSRETAESLLRELGASEQQIADLERPTPYQRSQGLRVYGGAAKPRAKRSKAA